MDLLVDAKVGKGPLTRIWYGEHFIVVYQGIMSQTTVM